MAKWSKREQRTERNGIDRPPAEYHFFRSRKFFVLLFVPRPSSPSPSSFQEYRDEMRGGKENFPFLRFRSYVPDCVLSRCQTRRAVSSPVVCQSRRDISLRESPSFHSFFSFFRALSTTKSSPMRGLRDDALLPRRVRKTTRRQEKIRRNSIEVAWVGAPAWNRGDLLLRIRKLFSESNCAWKGSIEFSLPRYDL